MINEQERLKPSDALGSGNAHTDTNGELSADILPHPAPAKGLSGSAGAVTIARLVWMELGS